MQALFVRLINVFNSVSFLSAPEDWVSFRDVPSVWEGYRRKDGRVGTRNEIWVLNTVGCVNHASERIAKLASERFAGKVDGVYAFTHPYGCDSWPGNADHLLLQRTLAGMARHVNVGAVLLVGLGCESNQISALLDDLRDRQTARAPVQYSRFESYARLGIAFLDPGTPVGAFNSKHTGP